MAKCVCWKCRGSGVSSDGLIGCDECWGYPYTDCTDEEYEANERRMSDIDAQDEYDWSEPDEEQDDNPSGESGESGDQPREDETIDEFLERVRAGYAKTDALIANGDRLLKEYYDGLREIEAHIESDRLAREQHALAMLAADALPEISERAQVVEDALREDAERESFDSWRNNHDVPIPFEITPLGEEIARQNENDARHCGSYTLTEKGIATFQPYAALILEVRARRAGGRL